MPVSVQRSSAQLQNVVPAQWNELQKQASKAAPLQIWPRVWPRSADGQPAVLSVQNARVLQPFQLVARVLQPSQPVAGVLRPFQLVEQGLLPFQPVEQGLLPFQPVEQGLLPFQPVAQVLRPFQLVAQVLRPFQPVAPPRQPAARHKASLQARPWRVRHYAAAPRRLSPDELQPHGPEPRD
jgi:hypothetical protein